MSVETDTRHGSLREGVMESFRVVGALRIPELMLGFLLIFEGTQLGLPLPFNQIALVFILGLSLLRRPVYSLGKLQVLIPIVVVALFYIGMVSMVTESTEFAFDWKRRLLRLVLTAAFLFVLASGRIDMRSLLVGYGGGMVVNAAAFYTGFAPDNYDGTLSGFFEDKNVAGLIYAVIGILIVSLARRPWPRLLVFLGMGYLVLLTDSRTSITAYAAAGLWLLIGGRLPRIGRWLLGALIWFSVVIAAEDFARIGRFSGREGSDELRARIDAASEIRVGEAGFFGEGLGEAYVFLNEQAGQWLFHNSYWTFLVEGGWPWLLVVLGITLLVGLRPFRGRLTPMELAGQAATVALLICAWRLGEVLFTLQWAIVIAYSIQASLASEGARFVPRTNRRFPGNNGDPARGGTG